MESNRKIQMRVGFFLALGLFAAIVSILALGGDRSLFTSYIRLNARLSQVQGLNIGSIVSLSGMTIGNIEEIGFGDKADTLIVKMKVDRKFQERISKESTVEVRTQGALGDKYVYITPGRLESGTVVDGDTLEAAKSSDLMGILSEKGAEAGKVFDIITAADRMMKSFVEDNRTEKLMRNLVDVSANLRAATEDARQLMGELRTQNSGTMASSLKRLDSVLSKIDRGEGTLGALVNDPSLHEQMKAVFGGSPRKQYFQSILQNSIEKKDAK